MSEKFRKIVNAPHKAVGRITQGIKRTQPKGVVGNVAKGAGMTVTGLSQFLLWMAKYVTLDNHLLRAWERALGKINVGKNENGEKNKFQEFIKQNPNLAAHVIYYMMTAAIVWGAKLGLDNSELAELGDQIKIEREIKKAKAGTYAEYLDKMKPVVPYLVADLVAKEGVVTNENGEHVPYLDGQGVWTIGFGSTVLKDGTRVNKNTPPITTQQAYELASWHIVQKETLFRLWCYDVAFDKVDINSAAELIALSAATYNVGTDLIEQPRVDGKRNRAYNERFAELDKLHKEYGNAITADMVRGVFAKYPVKHPTSVGEAWLYGKDKGKIADALGNFLKGGNGLRWRRWLEAQVMKGNIKPEVFLQIPVGAMYEFYNKIGEKRENWFIEKKGQRIVNDKTLQEFLTWVKNPTNKSGQALTGARYKPVIDWLPKDVASQCLAGKCEIGASGIWENVFASKEKRNELKQVEIKTYVIGYEDLYADAIGSFKAGDYNAAAKKYEKMIEQYPDNALLRNDLAATYNKLGRYDDTIVQAREVLKRIGDRSQYGAAQYNAGFAYEQLGNLQKALANYKLALASGNRRVQRDITRVAEKMKQGKNAKMAFGVGKRQIQSRIKKSQNNRGDLFVYGKTYQGNMA